MRQHERNGVENNERQCDRVGGQGCYINIHIWFKYIQLLTFPKFHKVFHQIFALDIFQKILCFSDTWDVSHVLSIFLARSTLSSDSVSRIVSCRSGVLKLLQAGPPQSWLGVLWASCDLYKKNPTGLSMWDMSLLCTAKVLKSLTNISSGHPRSVRGCGI